jgi:transcriptional regulator with XRE-family HTH domain
MPESLWKIRERKGLSVNQLAAKSGVPAISIAEYESGHPIRSADLPKLAKALYVEEWDIQLQGEARPKKAREAVPSKPEPPPEPKRERREALARPTQIEHLLNLTSRHFDKDRAVLEQEMGKPLEQMTRSEASSALREYQQRLQEKHRAETGDTSEVSRKRAYLPEGVDEFERNYLQERQEDGATICFTLFNGQQMSGRIVGFGPYSITIVDVSTDNEVTIQKLAIAYYSVVDAGAAEARSQTQQNEDVS